MPNYVTVTATIGAAANVSSAVCIEGYNNVLFDVPAFTCEAATSSLRIDGCDTSTGTFRPVFHQGVASAASGGVVWETKQSAGDYVVTYADTSKPKYIKLRSSSTTTAAVAAKVFMY